MSQQLHLGHYRLSRTLGIGAFGKVKLAEHVVTNQKVAIKILNKFKVRELDMVEKVKREINILRACKHPHIIRLYEVIDTPTDTFVVMEYVPNGELFDYIVTRGRLGTNEARQIFQQLISSIEYCHHKRIVHRDLKPENLLLDSDNNIKLADFGLSNICHDGEFLKTSCGSPNYAAPEIISGHLYAGPEVDVWSCGVILFALLCGSLPFDNDSIPLLFKEIKEGRYTIPPHVDLVATDLLRKMLVVDPLKRLSIQEVKTHPWFRHKLSPYLSLQPFQLEEEENEVDMDVVGQVAALSFPHQHPAPRSGLALGRGQQSSPSSPATRAIQIRQTLHEDGTGSEGDEPREEEEEEDDDDIFGMEEEEEGNNSNNNNNNSNNSSNSSSVNPSASSSSTATTLSQSWVDPREQLRQTHRLRTEEDEEEEAGDEESQMAFRAKSRVSRVRVFSTDDDFRDPLASFAALSGSLPQQEIEKIEELDASLPLPGLQDRDFSRSFQIDTVVRAVRGENRRTDLRVAYELLLDIKRRKRRVSEQKRMLGTSASASLSMAMSPMAPSSIDLASPLLASTLSSDALGLGADLEGEGPVFVPNLRALEELLYPEGLEGFPGQFVRQRRWYLGIQSKRDPGRVMREVFQALANVRYEWKIITPYRVICQKRIDGGRDRTGSEGGGEEDEEEDEEEAAFSGSRRRRGEGEEEESKGGSALDMKLRIALSLYKVHSKVYLLDFQKTSGSQFSFMDQCECIISELKRLSKAQKSA